MECASEIIKKLSPLKVSLCKIPSVKDGFFGRSKNNKSIDKYNEALEKVATELSGVLEIDVVFLNYILETKDKAMMMEYIHHSVMVYLNLSEMFQISTFILGLRCRKLK